MTMARVIPKSEMANITVEPIGELVDNMAESSDSDYVEPLVPQGGSGIVYATDEVQPLVVKFKSKRWKELKLDSIEKRVVHVAEHLEDQQWDCFHDVVFHVGSEKTPVKSSKLLLSLRLPYFERLFATSGENSIKDDEKLEEESMKDEEGTAAKFEPEIVVFGEFNPQPFKEVIQSLHADTPVDLKGKDFNFIFEVMNIGTHLKYWNVHRQCNAALGPFGTMEGACQKINQIFHDPKASESEMSMCHTYVSRFQQALLRSKAFLTLSQRAVHEIVKANLQKIEEIDVFRAVLRWAKHKAGQKGEVSAEDGVKLRNALGDILYEIRFTSMSAEQIVDLAQSAKVLNSSEVVNFIMFINSGNGTKPSVGPFKTQPRSECGGSKE